MTSGRAGPGLIPPQALFSGKTFLARHALKLSSFANSSVGGSWLSSSSPHTRNGRYHHWHTLPHVPKGYVFDTTRGCTGPGLRALVRSSTSPSTSSHLTATWPVRCKAR